jgi:uncharacterized MnhB-related membrane protein
MSTAIVAVLGVVIVGSAILALLHRSLLTAILAAGAVSLVASVLYLFLAAPDVAMTEAAVGSALTTLVFLFALSRIRAQSRREGGDGE